ncbi:MAG TPA: hypothetical protein VGD69_06950 [Herpetosiphonaceae bacterium]
MHWMRFVRSRLVALILAGAWLVSLLVTPASAREALSTAHATTQDVEVTAEGTLRLAKTASEAPATYGSFQRFGIYDSSTTSFPKSFNQLRVSFQRTAPAANRARLDVRASTSDDRWSEWQLDVKSGANVRFAEAMTSAQYRVVLLSNSAASPTIASVALEPQQTRGFKAQNEAPAVAPTYRLRVTRQGMVGGRTANGHIIKPNDFFVSLPSRRALSSRGGNEYQVRLSANGKSVVVPVWDNGPWNHNDDYWNENRAMYKDLPVGWPQDHAAYYEKHNGGRAERGYVRFPTAVDIGDGAYWALGLDGAQATVDVTFLWKGRDPGPNPKPLNSKPSQRPSGEIMQTPEPTPTPPTPTPQPTPPPEPDIIVDDTGKSFFSQGEGWNQLAGQCAYGGQARMTTTINKSQVATHQAVWRPAVRGGTYDVYAFIPPCPETGSLTVAAQYIIHHAQGDSFVTINQRATFGTWALLGRYSFAPGSDGYVQLRNTDPFGNYAMVFDALKVVAAAP